MVFIVQLKAQRSASRVKIVDALSICLNFPCFLKLFRKARKLINDSFVLLLIDSRSWKTAGKIQLKILLKKKIKIGFRVFVKGK